MDNTGNELLNLTRRKLDLQIEKKNYNKEMNEQIKDLNNQIEFYVQDKMKNS